MYFCFINLSSLSCMSVLFPCNRYYGDDGYDRRSIQRSLSHPSLARSGAEIIEQHWIFPDDISEDSNPPRNLNQLVIIITFNWNSYQTREKIHLILSENHFRRHSNHGFNGRTTRSPSHSATFNRVHRHSNRPAIQHRHQNGIKSEWVA